MRLSVGAQARSAGGPGVWVWWPDSETDSDFTAPNSPPPGRTVTLVDVQSAGESRISAGLEVQARERRRGRDAAAECFRRSQVRNTWARELVNS